jgi:hypothetical protein
MLKQYNKTYLALRLPCFTSWAWDARYTLSWLNKCNVESWEIFILHGQNAKSTCDIGAEICLRRDFAPLALKKWEWRRKIGSKGPRAHLKSVLDLYENKTVGSKLVPTATRYPFPCNYAYSWDYPFPYSFCSLYLLTAFLLIIPFQNRYLFLLL